jgi:nitroimidazol reductase NimA-like FMN-containing flavoprotein (pyridoxamine 5'-phosphate oxidase superfamily)
MSVSDEVAEHLRGAVLPANLATSVDDRPHVAPVWYVYEDGHLLLSTGGRKLANIETNPRVAAAIESTGGDHWLVTLRGTATVVDDDERTRTVARRLFEKYTGDPAPAAYTDADGDPEGSLVDVRIGSASLQTY